MSTSYVIDVQEGKQLHLSRNSLADLSFMPSIISSPNSLFTASWRQCMYLGPQIFVLASPTKNNTGLEKHQSRRKTVAAHFPELVFFGNEKLVLQSQKKNILEKSLLGIWNLTHPHSCLEKLAVHSISQLFCVYIL